jgi:hypothetical protein
VKVNYAGKSITRTSDLLVTMSGAQIYTPTARAIRKSLLSQRRLYLQPLLSVLIVIVVILVVLNIKWMQRRHRLRGGI